jgi:hypothetical protein
MENIFSSAYLNDSQSIKKCRVKATCPVVPAPPEKPAVPLF